MMQAATIVVLLHITASLANAQICTVSEIGFFQSASPQAGASFGRDVEVDGNRAVIGAVGEEAAYVFEGSGTAWQQIARLTPSDAPVAGFGVDVDLDGDRIVVGTHLGRFYVFDLIGSAWTETATITSSDFNPGTGHLVALAGNQIVASYPGAAKAYIFEKFGLFWLETRQLIGDVSSIDIQPNTIAISSKEGSTGNIRIYTKMGATWPKVFTFGSIGLWSDVALTESYLVAAKNGAYPFFVAEVVIFSVTSGNWQLDKAFTLVSAATVTVDASDLCVVASTPSITETFERIGPDWVPGYKTSKGGVAALAGDVVLCGDYSSSVTATNDGSVRLCTFAIPFVPYGSGCPGTGGLTPKLSYTGCPSVGSSVTLSITSALSGSVAILFFGFDEIQVPLNQSGCSFLVGSLIPLSFPVPLFGAGPGLGEIHVSFGIPPGTPVASITSQAIVQDPVHAQGAISTNGVRVTLR